MPPPSCPVGSFTEQDERIAVPRTLLTERACWWAIGQLRREHGSISGLARQMGTTWHTVWDSIRLLLQVAADDATRFAGAIMLGVDEYVWHHVSERKHGPKFLAGIVDLSPRKREVPRYLFGGPRVRVAGRLPRYGFGAPDDACLGWCCRRGRWPSTDR